MVNEAARAPASLQQAVTLRPDDLVARYDLARALMHSRKPDEALIHVQAAAGQANAPAYFHFMEFQLQLERGAAEQAWSAWQRYVNDA